MPAKKNPKAAAEERQATLQAERDVKAAKDRENEEAAVWSVGADSRSAQRQKELEDKALAKAQKKAEKDLLLAEDESSTGVKKAPKPKKVKDDAFAELNAALASTPKTKAQKLAEEKKKQDDEKRKKEEEESSKREEKRLADDKVRKQAAAKGINLDHADDMMVQNTNRMDSEFEDVSGLDAAIGLLTVKGDEAMQHPEKKQKAAYNAYFDRMLPQMKEDCPGLKLSQYKERIFDMWQKAPENPMNIKRREESGTL